MKRILLAVVFCLLGALPQGANAQVTPMGAQVAPGGACPSTAVLAAGVGRYVYQTSGGALCVSGGGSSSAPWTLVGLTNISVTSSSVATALPASAASLWLINTGTTTAYYALGTTSGVTATTSSSFLAGGACTLLVYAPNTYIATISATSGTLQVQSGMGTPLSCGGGGGGGSISNTSFGAAVSPVTTNPTSTLAMTSATTAYTAGQLIASSATAGSVVVPSFAIANSAGAASVQRLRLSSNDTTTTAWASQVIQVDLWTAAPTFTNGDRGTWSPATGAASHLGAFTCAVSPSYGDGYYAECAPTVGVPMPKLASGTAIYWTMEAISGSGVTGASKTFTLTAELGN